VFADQITKSVAFCI